MNDRIEEAISAFMDEFCQPGKGVRDGIRAASAVLGDQGLRKAAQDAVYRWFGQSPNRRASAFMDGVGPMEQLMGNLKAALTRQDGPSQAVNYVSTSHEGNRMRCLSCDTEQYPNCKVCGAMLMNEVAPNDGRYSWAQIEGVLWRVHAPEPWHRAFPNAALETIHNALKPTPESTQEPSQQEAKPRAALCVGCLCIEGCSVNGLCPVHGDNAPAAPVQPSTEDVVERMDWKYCQIRGVPAQDVDAHLRALTAALAVARAGWAPKEDPEITPLCVNHAELWYCERKHIATKSGCIFCDFEEQKAGWHSWESVEKAIRDVMLFGQYGIHEKREFIKRLCTRLTQDAKAEPAERVTVKLVKTAIGHDMWNVFLDGQDQGVQFLEQHDAERYAAGLRAELGVKK